MLELVNQPPTTANQLLAVAEQHASNLNAAVQHVPAAPKWVVSSAVKKGVKQLVQLLQQPTAAAAAQGGTGPDALDSDSNAVSTSDAAAATAGNVHAAVGAAVQAGLPLLVNGQLVVSTGGQQGEQQGGASRKKHKSDEEFRARLIKKFSAKTQVGCVLWFAHILLCCACIMLHFVLCSAAFLSVRAIHLPSLYCKLFYTVVNGRHVQGNC